LLWNSKYPVDFFYRKKHNIAFGSPEHRAANFIYMLIDLKEDSFVEEYFKNKDSKNKFENLSQKQIDYDFEHINLDEL